MFEAVLCACPGLCCTCRPGPRRPCCRAPGHAIRSPMQCARCRRNRVGRPVPVPRDAPRLCRSCSCSPRPRRSCCRATRHVSRSPMQCVRRSLSTSRSVTDTVSERHQWCLVLYQTAERVSCSIRYSLDVLNRVIVFWHNHSPSRHTTSRFFGIDEAFKTFVSVRHLILNRLSRSMFRNFCTPNMIPRASFPCTE